MRELLRAFERIRHYIAAANIGASGELRLPPSWFVQARAAPS